jgi:hypothetical protein
MSSPTTYPDGIPDNVLKRGFPEAKSSMETQGVAPEVWSSSNV